MKISFVFIATLFFQMHLCAQIDSTKNKSSICYASISGTVYEHGSKEAVMFADVALYQNNIFIKMTESDFDGNFSFTKLKAGVYDVEVSFLGLQTTKKKGIEIKQCLNTNVTFYLKEESCLLDAIEVVSYSTPLIKAAASSQHTSILASKCAGISIESYDKIEENKNVSTKENNISTFSVDVDRASYSNVRRFLNNEQLPPKDAVRIEELINYFTYGYPGPKDDKPFAFNTEISACPWNKKKKLLRIGVQGKRLETKNLPPTNLVFLIDVSGSMGSENKLPLVKESLKLLVDQMRQDDKIALVVYAGAAGLVLPSTNASEKTKIKAAIDALGAGGSTAGGAGIKLAYKTATDAFIPNGNNRVVLATDGDFNVGESSDDALLSLIEKERTSGVFISVLGFGMGNYKDSKMQKIADAGNGNHAYVDNIFEAKKLFINEFGGTLFTIAKDVKIQVHFNPSIIADYRLIGYENRMLSEEDFEDDKKDAGDIGAGHSVTALYEIKINDKSKVKLKFKKNTYSPQKKNELGFIQFRYKAPDGDKSKLIKASIENSSLFVPSKDQILASAVAEFGLILRDSKYKKQAGFKSIYSSLDWISYEENEFTDEFYELVRVAERLLK